MRLAAALALLLAAAAPPPDWIADAAGSYGGLVHNAGRMECQRTEFTVRDGTLVGHYWIDDDDPFEGDLTGFVPDGARSGRFTWTDRYGSGAAEFSFSPEAFTGSWGTDAPDAQNPMWGVRGGIPFCNKAVS